MTRRPAPAVHYSDITDRTDLPIDVRAARAWKRIGHDNAEATRLRHQVRLAVSEGLLDVAQDALDALLSVEAGL